MALDELEEKIKKQETVNEQTKKELEKLKEGLNNGKDTQEIIDNLTDIINDNPDNS